MRKKEYERLLAERDERIRQMEQQLLSTNQVLDHYRQREQTIVDMMDHTNRMADKTIRDAQESAKAIRRDAQREADEVIDTARNERTRIESEIRQKSEAYETKLAQYNETLKIAAQKAQAYANQFASVATTLNIKTPSQYILDEVEAESKNADDKTADNGLPDAEGSPAKLMYNIYKLENRVLPRTVDPNAPENADDDSEETLEQPKTVEQIKPEPAFDFLSIGIDPAEFGFDPNPPKKQQTEPPQRIEYEPAEPVQPEPMQQAIPLPPTAPEAPEEPDWDAVPTVSQYVQDAEDDEEISLDALLDEIIKSGE